MKQKLKKKSLDLVTMGGIPDALVPSFLRYICLVFFESCRGLEGFGVDQGKKYD